MIKKMVALLVVVAIISTSSQASALTPKQCKSQFNGDVVSRSQLRSDYNKKNCDRSKGGTCDTVASKNDRGIERITITCGGKAPQNVNGSGSNSVNAGKLSASCADKGDVCVKQLPRTNFGPSTVKNILSIILGIIGAISVLFIAIGGLRYVLSQGDPQAVGKAKGTIVYAVVGLIIAIVAQGIVVLVVNTVLS